MEMEIAQRSLEKLSVSHLPDSMRFKFSRIKVSEILGIYLIKLTSFSV
jgi:hypothetical protein